jgi:plasmid stabilization system protein ParE
MLPVIWSSEALDDLDGIAAFITESNPAAAAALVVRIEDVTEPLSLFPYMGRPGRVHGTRELFPHPNYCLIYEVKAACIEVTGVAHVRREYP